MGIFLKIENKQPLAPIPYKAPGVSRMRWYLLVLLLCLPMGFLMYKFLKEFLFVQFSGSVVYDTFLIRAPDEGYIQNMAVTDGQPVRRGEVLLQMSSPKLTGKLNYLLSEKFRISNLINNLRNANQAELTNALKVAEQDIIDSQKTYERFKKYFNEGNLITLQLEEARKNYSAAQQNYSTIKQKISENALQHNTLLEVNYNRRLEEINSEIKLIQAQLNNFIIHAPQQGTIMNSEAHVGEYVQVGTNLLTVVTDNNLKIKAYIEPKYSSVATFGKKVMIQFPNREKIPGIIVNSPRYAQQLPSSQSNPLATRENKLVAIIAPKQPVPKEYRVYGIPVQVSLE
ncbi:HlyD family secretion protein [Legionella sp. D16C41]|uniref:HlyD family secretion protein n=1 Tax=Legionella sp. D16C41 TaxID=3402688 RepID=UPI003AF93D83